MTRLATLLAVLLCLALAGPVGARAPIEDLTPTPPTSPTDATPDSVTAGGNQIPPTSTPAPPVCGPRPAPAYDCYHGSATTSDMEGWVQKWGTYEGANWAIVRAILRGEGGYFNPYTGWGDSGASRGPAQIQYGFLFGRPGGLVTLWPDRWGWLTWASVDDPETAVSVVAFAVAHGWAGRWSAYYTHYLGTCPPWWSASFCAWYWAR